MFGREFDPPQLHEIYLKNEKTPCFILVRGFLLLDYYLISLTQAKYSMLNNQCSILDKSIVCKIYV